MSSAPVSAQSIRTTLARVETGVQASAAGPVLRRLRAVHLDQGVARAAESRRGAAVIAQLLYRTLVGRPPHRRELKSAREQLAAGASYTDLIEHIQQTQDGVDWAVQRGTEALRADLRRRFEQGRPEDEPRLVFLHIMKVGGSSLSDMVRRLIPEDRVRMHVFLDDLVLMPPQLLRQMSLIGGHIPYEALSYIPGPYSTLTVLRDPYQRLLSHFGHLREVRSAHRDLTLERFVFDDEFAALSGNYQARQLVHRIDLDGAWQTYSPTQRCRAAGGDPDGEYPLQSLFDSAPVTMPDEQLLDEAATTLAAIDYVGITENLDRTGAAIARLFGCPARPLDRLNTSRGIDPNEIDTRIRRRIDERTAVDRQLYELATERAQALL
jgi:hypothetical protein